MIWSSGVVQFDIHLRCSVQTNIIPIITIGSHPIIALPSGSGVGVISSVLAPGGGVPVSGKPISLGSSDNLIIGSSTLTFSLPTATPVFLPSSIATIASQPIFALPPNWGIRVGIQP